MTLIAAHISQVASSNGNKRRLTIGSDLRATAGSRSLNVNQAKYLHKGHLVFAVAGRYMRIIPALKDAEVPPLEGLPFDRGETHKRHYIEAEIYHWLRNLLNEEGLLTKDPANGYSFDGEILIFYDNQAWIVGHGFDRSPLNGDLFAIGGGAREAMGAMSMATKYCNNAYEIVNNTLHIAGDCVEGIKPPYRIQTFDWNIEAEQWEEATDYAIQNPPIEVAVLSDSIPQEVYTDLETPALSNHAKQYASMVESEY